MELEIVSKCDITGSDKITIYKRVDSWIANRINSDELYTVEENIKDGEISVTIKIYKIK